MNRSAFFRMAAIASTAVIGLVAWCGYVLALPLALLFPIVWSKAPSRLDATAIAAAYFLAASRGLPEGVSNFYGSGVLAGLVLWVAAALGFVLVYGVCWTSRPGLRKPVGFGFASAAMILPPFGIAGWAHPITAAGVLFPTWGWFGLIATAVAMVALTTRRWPIAVAAIGGLWAWSAASWTPIKLPEDWRGVDTQLGASLGRGFDLDQYGKLLALALKQAPFGAKVVVLPESSLGFLTPTTAHYWARRMQGTDVTVLAGAVVIEPGGYDSVMVALNRKGVTPIYRERMPVPVSMWQPWRGWFGTPAGARANFFENPVVSVASRRVATLICYEQLITWPILQSMLYNPDLIVAPGNGWWARGTSIIAIQQASATAWARLFGKPIIFSYNI